MAEREHTTSRKHWIVTIAALLLLSTAPAHANDCEAKAALVVSKLGATIERRSSTVIFLKHAAVPGGFTLDCSSPSVADDADFNISWDGASPSDTAWSITSAIGAIVADAPLKEVEAGARACYKAAQDGDDMADWAKKDPDRSADLTIGSVRYAAVWPDAARNFDGSFSIDIFHRDAAPSTD